MKTVVRYLRRLSLLQEGAGPTDGQLLEAFLTARDEAAFETLLRRYAPMVLGVCQRVLQNAHDAEDAFQATFLVLVRKASTVRPREMVGNWLYGVACRTALKARAMNMKRRTKEREVRSTGCPEDPPDGAREELLKYLDAEVSRLPDKYRIPVVLCELRGKSRKEVARLLGLPEGTLSWRLAWARKLLARRLSRHGVALPAGALAAALCGTASACVSPFLLTATAKAAMQVAAGQALTAGTVPAQVVTLTEGVLKAMLLSKLKVILIVALAISLGAGTTGLTYRVVAAEPTQARDMPQPARVVADELEELRLEVEALRKGLQATRERVKSLEGEVQALKRQRTAGFGMGGGAGLGGQMGGGGLGGFGMMGMGGGALGAPGAGALGMRGGGGYGPQPKRAKPRVDVSTEKPKAEDPLTEAETALKELRQHPDSKQAADRLEHALQRLKEQAKRKGTPEK